MSKGPGRIERTIRAAFADSPSRIYSVEQLAELAYPGVNCVEKKHRVAVIRAARAAGWRCGQSEAPGHPLVYFNPLDVRSYALSRLRRDFLNHRLSDADLEGLLDTPDCHRSHWAYVQPGGVWWMHVGVHRAERAGDAVKAAAIRAELNAKVDREFAERLRKPL